MNGIKTSFRTQTLVLAKEIIRAKAMSKVVTMMIMMMVMMVVVIRMRMMKMLRMRMMMRRGGGGGRWTEGGRGEMRD